MSHHSSGDGLANMKEFQYLSGIIYGNRFESSVHSDSIPESIYDMKGILSFLFHNSLNMNVRYDYAEDYAMDQAQNIIVNNLKIGNYGRISEKFIKDLRGRIFGKFLWF
ncbi:MAG: hypothetical protein ACJZ10_01015 [Candidatus Neomarinimicrobiota bacterium]